MNVLKAEEHKEVTHYIVTVKVDKPELDTILELLNSASKGYASGCSCLTGKARVVAGNLYTLITDALRKP